MNTTYMVIAIVVLVAVAVAIYFAQKPSVPSAEVSQEEVNAPEEPALPDVEQEIGEDVLPSEEELNIEVNDVTLELPEEI